MGMFREMRNMVKYRKHLSQMEKCYHFIIGNLWKRCAYCDYEVGTGSDFPVYDILIHFKEKHTDVLDKQELDKYLKVFGG